MKLKTARFLNLFNRKPSDTKDVKTKSELQQDLRNLYSMNRNRLNVTIAE